MTAFMLAVSQDRDFDFKRVFSRKRPAGLYVLGTMTPKSCKHILRILKKSCLPDLSTVSNPFCGSRKP